MERFNYQVVFKLDDTTRIIFTGLTSFEVSKLIETCKNRVVSDDCFIENIVYQPEKPLQDESKERK